MHDPMIVRLLDESRLADVRREREQRRLLADVAAESATLVGSLVDLADAGTPLTVRTRGGRVHTGSVVLVAADFAVLDGAAGQLWCRYAALAAVQVRVGVPPVAGSRGGLDMVIMDALALLAGDGPRVALDLSSGETVAGRLGSVGVDVVAVDLDGGDVLYVPSCSLDAVFRSG